MACSKGETGVERNWYPAGQLCCSPDAPNWIPKAAAESHVEKGTAIGTRYVRTLCNSL